jgi:hypothetical protein
VWLSCAVPMTGAHVERALAIAEPLPARFGFEPNLCLLGVSTRCAYLVVALVYDRQVEGEDERALACYHALHEAMNATGYYPSRLGIQAPLLAAEDDSARVLGTIKAALEPQESSRRAATCPPRTPGRSDPVPRNGQALAEAVRTNMLNPCIYTSPAHGA